jgi:hypothetical protein
MNPGYPDEIAKAVLFMASEQASYISAANLIVDGVRKCCDKTTMTPGRLEYDCGMDFVSP